MCTPGKLPSPLPKPSRHSPLASPEKSFYVTDGAIAEEKVDSKSDRRQSSNSRPRLAARASASKIKEDTTYGAEMLRLHRSLHAANHKLINTLSSPNPPSTPFSATFGYSGDLSAASVVPSGAYGANRGAGRRQDSLGQDELVYGQPRDKDKNGANTVETALAMGRMSSRLDKLAEVDEVVNQVNLPEIASVCNIASTFSSFTGSSTPRAHRKVRQNCSCLQESCFKQQR